MPAPAPPPPRTAWAALATSALLGGIPCFDQLYLSLAGRSSEAAHLVALPPAWLWVPATALFTGAVLLGIRALATGGNPQLARLPAVAAALALFLYVFVTPPVRPMARLLDVMGPIQTFSDVVAAQSPPGHLEADPARLTGFLAEVPPPTILVHGRRLERWALVVRPDCKGPIGEAPGVRAGTLLYCISDDLQRAWITATDTEGLFGAAEVAHPGGTPLFRELKAAPLPTAAQLPDGAQPDEPPADDAEPLDDPP